MVNWILSHCSGCSVAASVVQEAVQRGHFWALQVLGTEDALKQIQWADKNTFVNKAAENRHWGLVRWLCKRVGISAEAKERNSFIVHSALAQNNFEELKWATSYGFRAVLVAFPPCSEDDWRGQGRREMMRYLFDGGYGDPASLTGWTIILAAKFGDIPYLEWLNENYKAYLGGLWGTLTLDAFKEAAENGRVDIMEWMVTQLDDLVQPRGRTEAMFAAAKKGKVNVVKWLYEKYSDKPDIVLFREYDESASNYRPEDSESFYYGFDKFIPVTAMDAAAQNGHVEVLKFLNEAQKSADASGRAYKKRRISDWRVRIQYPRCTTVAMDAAAEAGQLETVKWLHFNRTEGCTTAAMDRAAAYGHFEVVKWLHFNRSEGCTTFAIDRVGQRQFDLQVGSRGRLLPPFTITNSRLCNGYTPTARRVSRGWQWRGQCSLET